MWLSTFCFDLLTRRPDQADRGHVMPLFTGTPKLANHICTTSRNHI
jgi:hypothetical protein